MTYHADKKSLQSALNFQSLQTSLAERQGNLLFPIYYDTKTTPSVLSEIVRISENLKRTKKDLSNTGHV